MTDIYSPALAVALGAAGLALALVAMTRLSDRGIATRLRAARLSSTVSLVALLPALASHLAIGHRPGSDSALGLVAFPAEHPAVPVVALAALLAKWLSRGTLRDGSPS